MIRALLVFAVLTVPALAQPAGIQPAPKETATPAPAAPKKMPSTLEPTPAPAPAANPAPVATPPKRSPDEIADQFFATLQADRVDVAYDTLNAEFALAGGADPSASIRQQTQKALDAYGPVLGHELVREEKLGSHLLRRTYILVGEQLPLRWRLYFYESGGRWKLIDLRIDDALVEWFDDPTKKSPPKN